MYEITDTGLYGNEISIKIGSNKIVVQNSFKYNGRYEKSDDKNIGTNRSLPLGTLHYFVSYSLAGRSEYIRELLGICATKRTNFKKSHIHYALGLCIYNLRGETLLTSCFVQPASTYVSHPFYNIMIGII